MLRHWQEAADKTPNAASNKFQYDHNAAKQILTHLFSAKPKHAYVLFYTTKRVGGGVQDFDAIKLLRFA